MDSNQQSTTQRRLAALREARKQQQQERQSENTTGAADSRTGLGEPSVALANLKAGILERASTSRDVTPLASARRLSHGSPSNGAGSTDERPRTLSMLAAVRDDDVACSPSSPPRVRGLADYLEVPLAHSSTRTLIFHLENDMRERILSEWSLSLTMTLASQQRRDLRLLATLAARAQAAEAAQVQAETLLAAERASRADELAQVRAECERRVSGAGDLYQTEITQLKATVSTLEESLKTAHAAAATAAASAAAAAAANAAAAQIAAAAAASSRPVTTAASPPSSLRDVLIQRQREAKQAMDHIRGRDVTPTSSPNGGRARSSSVRLDGAASVQAAEHGGTVPDVPASARFGRLRAGTVAVTRAASPDFVASHYAATSVPPPPPPPPESDSDRYLRSIMESATLASSQPAPTVDTHVSEASMTKTREASPNDDGGDNRRSHTRNLAAASSVGARTALEMLAEGTHGSRSSSRAPSTRPRDDRFANAATASSADVRYEHRCSCSVSLMRGKAPGAFTGGPGNVYVPIRCVIAPAGLSLAPTTADGAPPFAVPFRAVTRFRPVSSGPLQGVVVSFTGASTAGTVEVWWSVRDERSTVIAKLRAMCPNAAS